jgi:hypothetical protein
MGERRPISAGKKKPCAGRAMLWRPDESFLKAAFSDSGLATAQK